MDPHKLFDELVGVAKKLGLEVRIQAFHGPLRSQGGLCRLNGRSIVFIDAKSSVRDRGHTLAEVLASLDLEAVYIAPEARRLIEAMRGRRR